MVETHLSKILDLATGAIIADFTFRIGMTMYIGTHDVTKCERSHGCYRVTITHAWTHERYRHVGRAPVNDVAMAK